MRRHISLMAKHIRTYNCTLISKLKELNDFLAHKPQGLVFYAFRRRAFAYILKDQPYGGVNLPMIRGSVDVARQHCPTKRLTPMGLLVGETMRKRYKFTRKI